MTGTFDNWSKSEQLEKVGDHFEKTVTLPETSESILYKVRAAFCFLLTLLVSCVLSALDIPLPPPLSCTSHWSVLGNHNLPCCIQA